MSQRKKKVSDLRGQVMAGQNGLLAMVRPWGDTVAMPEFFPSDVGYHLGAKLVCHPMLPMSLLSFNKITGWVPPQPESKNAKNTAG